MGPDFWTYSVADNAADLEAFCRYCHTEHSTSRRLAINEIFHPDTAAAPV